eukprot:m.86204 g.86204  ORF g.86204 m.86204 type:complete len:91 (+) comp36494_c0_seq12:593-865(+)
MWPSTDTEMEIRNVCSIPQTAGVEITQGAFDFSSFGKGGQMVDFLFTVLRTYRKQTSVKKIANIECTMGGSVFELLRLNLFSSRQFVWSW